MVHYFQYQQTLNPCNVVVPDTYNDDIHVVESFNLDVPDIFKWLVVNVEGFVKILIYFIKVVDVKFKLVIDSVELVGNEFKLLNMVVGVLFKLVIDNVELVDNEIKLLNYGCRCFI